MGGSNREREECISLPKMCHSPYNIMLIILPNANAIKFSISYPESILFLLLNKKHTTDFCFFYVLRMTHFATPLNWRLQSEVSNDVFSEAAFTRMEQNTILKTLDCFFWLYFQKFWHNFTPKRKSSEVVKQWSSFFNFFRKMNIIQY